MIDFKNVTKIVTHSGHAHRDDFLSVCFVLAMCSEHQNMPSVYRRDPTESELNDPNVVVIDIGERHEPHLSNAFYEYGEHYRMLHTNVFHN